MEQGFLSWRTQVKLGEMVETVSVPKPAKTLLGEVLPDTTHLKLRQLGQLKCYTSVRLQLPSDTAGM